MDSSGNPANILALIPAYNEERKVAEVVEQTHQFLPVLVVDDGSTDETARRAEAAGATVVYQQPNQGKGKALRAGFRYALAREYQAVLTLDADGQHAPDEIPKFLAAYAAEDSDLIIGARRFQQMPIIRRLANSVGRAVFSWAMGKRIRDNQSGYRLISRRLMEAVLDSHQAGFEFEVEMIVICAERGFKLSWVPIRTIYAGEVSHIDPWRHTVNFFRIAWQARQRLRQGSYNHRAGV